MKEKAATTGKPFLSEILNLAKIYSQKKYLNTPNGFIFKRMNPKMSFSFNSSLRSLV